MRYNKKMIKRYDARMRDWEATVARLKASPSYTGDPEKAYRKPGSRKKRS